MAYYTRSEEFYLLKDNQEYINKCLKIEKDFPGKTKHHYLSKEVDPKSYIKVNHEGHIKAHELMLQYASCAYTKIALQSTKNLKGVIGTHWSEEKRQKMQEVFSNGYIRNMLSNQDGENNHQAKLKEKQAIEIFQRSWSNENQHNLAREYNISLTQVNNIKYQRKWKKATAPFSNIMIQQEG